MALEHGRRPRYSRTRITAFQCATANPTHLRPSIPPSASLPPVAVSFNHTWLNAAAQLDASDSVLAHYRALIRLRHDLAILVDGDFTPLMEDDPQIWAYTRSTPTARVLVIANCGRAPRTVDVGGDWVTADLLLGNQADTPLTMVSSSLELAGWDARVYGWR